MQWVNKQIICIVIKDRIRCKKRLRVFKGYENILRKHCKKEGAPRGSFLKIAFPCAFFFSAIVFRIALHSVPTCVSIDVGLVCERCFFGSLLPHHVAFRCVLVLAFAPRTFAALLRHKPHLLHVSSDSCVRGLSAIILKVASDSFSLGKVHGKQKPARAILAY